MASVPHLLLLAVTVQTLLELDRHPNDIPQALFGLSPMPRGTARQTSAFPRTRLPVPMDYPLLSMLLTPPIL